MKPVHRVYLSIGLVVVLAAGYLLYQRFSFYGDRTPLVLEWLRYPDEHPDWAVKAGEHCGEASFLLPTAGFIGYLWDDAWRIGQRHTGLDIFSAALPGTVPVVAAYDGYITRNTFWKSALIQRVPEDPLHPERQIWLYYTHMADVDGNSFIIPDIPPGTTELFVEAGTLLGYQGDYTGDSSRVSVHLHFSIVRDDGIGNYLSEIDIENTLDPSPYFGLLLNAKENPDGIPVCPGEEPEG